MLAMPPDNAQLRHQRRLSRAAANVLDDGYFKIMMLSSEWRFE
jgi:hypothetical protein